MKKKSVFLALLFLLLITTLKTKDINASEMIQYDKYRIGEFVDSLDCVDHLSFIVELNYEIEAVDIGVSIDDSITHEEAYEILIQHRNYIKDIYKSKNEIIIKNLGLESYKYAVSWFSPHFEILINSIEEFNEKKEELIYIFDNNEIIKDVSIIYGFEQECEINDDNYNTLYPKSDVLTDLGLNNLQYTGAYVNVGFLDQNIPNIDQGFDLDLIDCGSGSSDAHATSVARIVGGFDGIAPDAHLYCLSLNLNEDIVDCFNTLIDTCHVMLINISMKFCVFSMNDYSTSDSYIDWLIFNAKCMVIKSAGNYDSSTPEVCAPGFAMNAITVGSIDYNKKLSYFSNYSSLTNYNIKKPDVVAPGNMLSGFSGDQYPLSGTSFSAPFVTGIIALLMEQSPVLYLFPSLIKPIIINGCNKLPTQNDVYEEECGYGLVNYINSSTTLSNVNYSYFAINNETIVDGSQIISYYLSIPANTMVKINICFTNGGIEYSELIIRDYLTLCIPILNHYLIQLVDEERSLIVCDLSNITTSGCMIFKNNTYSIKNFKINVYLVGDPGISTQCTSSYAYSYTYCDHVHEYNYLFSQHSSEKHKSYCGCNNYILSNHIVDSSMSGRFKRCIKCNYFVDTLNNPIITN